MFDCRKPRVFLVKLQTEECHHQQEGAGPVGASAPRGGGLMDDVGRQGRSARLLAVAHAVEVTVEPVHVVVREAAAHRQRAAALLSLDPVTHGVEVEEDVVIPALPHAAASALTERPAAESRCRGDVQDVRVHDLLQVSPGVKAGVLQDFWNIKLDCKEKSKSNAFPE